MNPIITKTLLISIIGIIFLGYSFCPKNYFNTIPDCSNREIFQDKYVPLSDNYQSEVLSIIKNKKPNDFRYLFKTFLEDEKDAVFMLVNFRNSQYCFDAKIFLYKWDKLGRMRKTNGKSYPKELYDLDWNIEKVDGEDQIVYIDMHRILD